MKTVPVLIEKSAAKLPVISSRTTSNRLAFICPSETNRICSLPVTREKDLPLQYVRWKPEDPLVEGTYGVAVPEKQEPVTMPEALLIPCVGYTRNRFRLGYGGGFFDRTLACHPSTHTIGIAYSCLLTDFTTEENDIPLACIITENGIVL